MCGSPCQALDAREKRGIETTHKEGAAASNIGTWPQPLSACELLHPQEVLRSLGEADSLCGVGRIAELKLGELRDHFEEINFPAGLRLARVVGAPRVEDVGV